MSGELPYDYSDDLADAPSTNELAELSSLANDLYLAELEVATKKRELEEAQAKADDISQQQIPDLMETLGIEEFTTTSGVKISIRAILRAAPPAARRAEAYRYLEEKGFGDLIKRNIVVGFGRGEEEAAANLVADLDGKGLRTKDEVKVEPQTLKKWVKGQLAAGVHVPPDLFGVREFRQAKIKAKPESAFGD
jgi:hypothetical protein